MERRFGGCHPGSQVFDILVSYKYFHLAAGPFALSTYCISSYHQLCRSLEQARLRASTILYKPIPLQSTYCHYLENMDASNIKEKVKDINDGSREPQSSHPAGQQGGPNEDTPDLETGEKQIERVGWDGDEDPQNPMNWPSKWRIGHVLMASSITLLTYVTAPLLDIVAGN